VQATGPDNQIRAQDVQNFVATAPAAKQPAPQAQRADYEDINLNNFRAVTAKRLLQSKQTIPHYYLSIDFEVDNILKYCYFYFIFFPYFIHIHVKLMV
jgi:pyruvate dehydrogenase E2 component (dihydrolipoamide acetyltransferase)